jgi:hypothetical protein
MGAGACGGAEGVMTIKGPTWGFPARYPGVCTECDEPIKVGDQIITRGNGGNLPDYRHAICPEAVPEKPTRFQGTTLEDMGL